MPIFFKYTIEDLGKLSDGGCDHESVNKFIDRHHYYTCICCGKEELYNDSPVLKDELWKEATGKLGIGCGDGCSVAVVRRVPEEKELREAVLFHRLFKSIRKVTPDGSYSMLCRECVERSLGRELFAEDLEDCEMTRRIIHRFKSRKDS